MIDNVSFIVIARNEEYAIEKSLVSLSKMEMKNCEILLIDSDSNDNTLSIMRKFAKNKMNVKIFKCTGYVNSAIARNIGLKNSKKNFICFCDGDTEWRYDFIENAILVIQNKKAGAVVGCLKEYVYSPGYKNIILKRIRHKYTEIKDIYYCGGNFIVRRDIALKVGLWDERLARNQDIDYTLRISRITKLIALPKVMGIHHTLEYIDRRTDFAKKRYSKFHGIVLRKNIDRPYVLFLLFFKKNRGFLFGYVFYFIMTSLIFSSLFFLKILQILLFVATFIIISDLIYGLIRKKEIKNRFIEHYFNPLFLIYGLLCKIDPIREKTEIQFIQ